MKLTGVPERSPNSRGILPIIKEVRAVCGLRLLDAKRLVERVRDGETVNLPLLPGEDPRKVGNALLGLGCSIHPDGDPPTREQIFEVNEEALFADGLEGALIGYVERFGQAPLALYDKAKCLEILMTDMNCPEDTPCVGKPCEHAYEMAREHFEFNTVGAWAGDNTPAFATLLTRDDA